jgi:hypothetical protein
VENILETFLYWSISGLRSLQNVLTHKLMKNVTKWWPSSARSCELQDVTNKYVFFATVLVSNIYILVNSRNTAPTTGFFFKMSKSKIDYYGWARAYLRYWDLLFIGQRWMIQRFTCCPTFGLLTFALPVWSSIQGASVMTNTSGYKPLPSQTQLAAR